MEDWTEELSLVFCTKIFKPDQPFFKRLQSIWDQESELETQTQKLAMQVESLPIGTQSKKDLKGQARGIFETGHRLREEIEACVQEMEEVRTEMFRVGKNMHIIKEQLLSEGISRSPREPKRKNRFQDETILGGGRSFKESQIEMSTPARVLDESPSPASSPVREQNRVETRIELHQSLTKQQSALRRQPSYQN